MSGARTKVAFLLPHLKCGGGERVALSVAKEMKRLGMTVEFVLMSKQGEFVAEAEEEFVLTDLSCRKTYELPLKLRAYVKTSRPDVVIASFWKMNLCACVVRALLPRFKLILWEHSPPSRTPFSPTWLYALSASLLYRVASAIVAVSQGVADDIRRHTIGLDRKVLTIYNAIPPPARIPNEARKIVSAERLIINVGRLEPQKDLVTLLEAFATLAATEAGVGCKLMLVGEGSQRQILQQMCSKLGIKDRVVFVGFSDNPYVLLRQADLFVLSSTFEGLGNVIVEALHCGLPVVSADCFSGPREILMDGLYGSLVEVGDVAGFAGAMAFELANPRVSEVQMKAAARFLPSRVTQEFVELMQ